jgi:hypothetical protein
MNPRDLLRWNDPEPPGPDVLPRAEEIAAQDTTTLEGRSVWCATEVLLLHHRFPDVDAVRAYVGVPTDELDGERLKHKVGELAGLTHRDRYLIYPREDAPAWFWPTLDRVTRDGRQVACELLDRVKDLEARGLYVEPGDDLG